VFLAERTGPWRVEPQGRGLYPDLQRRALASGALFGGMPERPKGAVCKIAGLRLQRFESSSRHWSP
jgi:hypothetical protein